MVDRYPHAKWRPLGKQTQPKMKAHNIICAHTMVGYLTSTDEMFHKNGYTGTESTYGIGGKWGGDKAADLDGVVYQWQDRDHTADANYLGNPEVISIETADNAPKLERDLERWTPAQADALIWLIAWECSLKAHEDCPKDWTCRSGVDWKGVKVAIPPVMIPDTKPGRRGLAVHRQGCEHSLGVGKVPGYLVVGGVRWSLSVGKGCPGDARIDQFKHEIIPAVQEIITSGGPFKMQAGDAAKIREIVVDVLRTEKIVPNKPTAAELLKDPKAETTFFTVTSALSNIEGDDDNRNAARAADLGKIQTLLEAIATKLDIPLP